MPDDEDIDDLPAAPAAPIEATLPKGGGLALDLLIEQAEEWREKSGKALPAEIGGIVLTGEKPEGNFILSVPAEPAPVTVRVKWWKDRNRWTPTCTCGQYKIHRSCGHIGPAARALRGMAAAAKGDALAKPTASSFAEEIAARAGRKLTPAEWKKIDGLHHCHQGFLKTGEISPWDLARAGWLPYHVTVSGQAFPAGVPLDIRDFWLCLAAEHRRLRLSIPDFMEPFSDPALASPTLVDFHASRERRTWQDWMDHHAHGALPGAQEEETTETDHRLRVENMHVHLEWSAGPEAAFKAIRETDARRLLQGGADGGLPRLNAEGLLVLRMMQADGFSSRTTLSLASAQDLRILAQILSFPFMRDRLCDEGGEPLPRHPGRLTWHLLAPAEGGADYRFELRTPDGDVLDREIIAVLPGPPVQYLAADGLRTGPAPLPEMHGGVVRVPAAVMESRVGLRLARRAGVEPPAAVARRVRVLRPRVVVKAWLGPDPRNRHGMETCWIDASATFPDQPGRSERLGGWGWVSASSTPRAPGDDFTEHDDHILRQTRDWIAEGGHIHDRSTQYWRRASMPVSFAEKFHAWLSLKPAGVELDLQGDLASFLDGEVRESLRVVVTPADQPDWFDLLVARDITDNLLTPAELDALRAAEGGWTRLPNGKWRRLVTEGGEDAEEALARLGLDGRESGTVRAHALQLAGAARGLLSEEDAESARRQAAAVRLRVTPEPPADLKAELRPYQREGYHFLCYLAENGFGGVLADDMGLGKTVQTLAWLLHLRATAGKKAPPSLVVCPKSVVENWTAEAGRFAPALRVRAWRGSELDRFAAEAGAADLHVLNYAQLRLLDGRWPAGGFLALVLDEAQAVKNPDSDSARAARGVKARHRLALTGTPIENRLLDLWSILNITMPGALPGRAEFGRRFNVKTDPHARLRLSARVRPFLLRRAKAQVATDLPERVEKDLLCVMEGEQHDLYQAELKTARSILLNLKIAKDLDRERFNILTSMLRLRQICCSPRLVNPNAAGDGAKLEALRDQLEPLLEEGQKVLVFSQFTGVLDLIGAMLEREFPAAPRFRLDGSTENRGELVAEFQKAGGAAVFLLSLKAGGFGLNLTAASTVILYDPWWNPAVEAQAIDRTHRIGQRNQVLACRLIAKDSIEEKIRQLQTAKKSLAADVLGEEAFSKSLSIDDFAFLFAEGDAGDQSRGGNQAG